ADGGPVTVTDPNITRYFMLTSEAVQLVMQAATLLQNNAIYILEMGDPVRIDDIAREMIRLNGQIPDADVRVVYTGLRPGEKLYEELYYAGKGLPTPIEKITVDNSPQVTPRDLLNTVDELLQDCYELPRPELLTQIKQLVPEFSGVKSGVFQSNRPIN
ncbi:MAG: polysaccharide biosynthesis protein, partial [Calditrichota bacterium]